MTRTGLNIRCYDAAFESNYKSKHLVARLKLLAIEKIKEKRCWTSKRKFVKQFGYTWYYRYYVLEQPLYDLPF